MNNETHVEVEDVPVSEAEEILSQIEHALHDKFDISHVTIQFECNRCNVKELV